MAMDTLVSQAYGARNFKFIGVVFQNALVVASLMFLPIALCFWFTEPVLLLLRQDPELARLAGIYNKWLLIGVLPLLVYRAQTQYLQNQRILAPAMFSGAVSMVLSIPLNWILIFGFPELPVFGLHGAALGSNLKVLGGWRGLGFIGAPIAGALTWTSQPILLWAYVTWTGAHQQSWSGCDIRQAISPKNLVTYLKLGVPGTSCSSSKFFASRRRGRHLTPNLAQLNLILISLFPCYQTASFMLAMEVIGFELATIVVGTFQDVIAIKAHAIGFNLSIFGFIIPMSIAIGATTRVGNRLGEGSVAGAKLSSLVGYIIVGSIQLLTSLTMVILRRVIASFYSDSQPVIDFCARLMPLVALMSFFDGTQTFNSALLRSIGRPLAGSIVNFVGYYLLALPIAAGLGWGTSLRTFGVWAGLIAGLAGATFGYFALIYRVDWDKEAQLAKDRVDSGDASAVLQLEGELESDTDYVPLEEGVLANNEGLEENYVAHKPNGEDCADAVELTSLPTARLDAEGEAPDSEASAGTN